MYPVGRQSRPLSASAFIDPNIYVRFIALQVLYFGHGVIFENCGLHKQSAHIDHLLKLGRLPAFLFESAGLHN